MDSALGPSASVLMSDGSVFLILTPELLTPELILNSVSAWLTGERLLASGGLR